LRHISVAEGKLLQPTTDGAGNNFQEVSHIAQVWSSAATMLGAHEPGKIFTQT